MTLSRRATLWLLIRTADVGQLPPRLELVNNILWSVLVQMCGLMEAYSNLVETFA